MTLYVNEGASEPALGMPRDLDGDGTASSGNVAASYALVPIKIQIDWVNAYGPQTRTLYHMTASED